MRARTRTENLLAQEKLRRLASRKCEKMPVEIQKIVPVRRQRPDSTVTAARLRSIANGARRVTRLQRVITRAACIFPQLLVFRRLCIPASARGNVISSLRYNEPTRTISFYRSRGLGGFSNAETCTRPIFLSRYKTVGPVASVCFIVRRASVIPSVRAMYLSIALCEIHCCADDYIVCKCVRK